MNGEYIAKSWSAGQACPAVDIADIPLFIRKEEKQNGIVYAEMQKKAITDALRNGVFVLTGGPGPANHNSQGAD